MSTGIVTPEHELEEIGAAPTTASPSASNARHVVGVAPRLPEPLAKWKWFTAPVRAERLAALRMGMGLALLFDVLVTYWPERHALFGSGSLGSAEVFAGRLRAPYWNWSVLAWADQPALVSGVLVCWALAAACLALGVRPRVAALVAWAIGISVLNTNYYVHNAGDRIRQIALLYLMLSPCGSAWSLDAAFSRRRSTSVGPTFVYPWALRLLVVQLAVMYCASGISKLEGSTWQSGLAIEHILTNLAWTRWSFADLPVPTLVLAILTWLALIWETGFPLWIAWRPTRRAAWLAGVAFHLGTGIALKLGMFPVYVLCCYLPLLPWEQLSNRFPGDVDAVPRAAP
ncbi:MAG: HTTM domain-containing protein [Pirellulales bacterium]|nr:HTTM domain-containing protein [Pirellulales bacterium]